MYTLSGEVTLSCLFYAPFRKGVCFKRNEFAPSGCIHLVFNGFPFTEHTHYSCCSLRKHAYSNILKKFLPSKNENFQIKNSDIFHISAQNIDCGYWVESPRRGGSNEYPQSMFLSRNKKNNVYPCKPQLYYTKVGFKGVKII